MVDFEGRLYYDFVSPEVYRLLDLLARAEQEGARLALEWRAFPASADAADAVALAAAELIRTEYPTLHGGFVQAMIVAIHLDGEMPGDRRTLDLAARVAGVPGAAVSEDRLAAAGAEAIAATVAEAVEIGVTTVPTLYRHGPVVKVRTTASVGMGPAVPRLEVIDAMLRDDGLWELSKP